MLAQEHSMIVWLIGGIAAGVVAAYLANRKKSRFREVLMNDFDLHQQKGTTKEHFSQLVQYSDSWIRSISIIRKPFNKTVNLAIETAALIYACVALVNAFVRSSEIFGSPVQAAAVLVMIGTVIAFIPFEWFLSGRIEKQISYVLDEIRIAIQKDELDAYFTQAKGNKTLAS
jgi:hypothetical protein